MYIFDTQEKSDPRNTNRFLLSNGKLRSFLVSGKVWSLSSSVCVDPPWDDREDQVEIAIGKFMEEEGASEWPMGRKPSVHCDISQLILGFTFGGTEESCALISPNCQHKLEFLIGTLDS